MKDRKAAHGLGEGSVSNKGTGECRFGREGLQVTECCVDVQSYTPVQSWRDGSEHDGRVGKHSLYMPRPDESGDIVTLSVIRTCVRYE